MRVIVRGFGNWNVVWSGEQVVKVCPEELVNVVQSH
jgi:hypothetical protein